MATATRNLPAKKAHTLTFLTPSPTHAHRGFQNVQDTPGSKSNLYQQQRFSYYGLTFHIEAEGWLDENAARIAIATLRNWVLHHSSDEATQLFVTLMRERAAIVDEMDFDYQQTPLPAVRAAQRDARRTGMQGREGDYKEWPLVILEAGIL